MALLCRTIDLDLEDPAEIHKDAKETIKYLQDVVKSVEKRVLEGEKVKGLKKVPGNKTRKITDKGYKYLESVFGKEKVYKTVEKPIGITELEDMVSEEELADLYKKNVIVFKESKPKVVNIHEEGEK